MALLLAFTCCNSNVQGSPLRSAVVPRRCPSQIRGEKAHTSAASPHFIAFVQNFECSAEFVVGMFSTTGVALTDGGFVARSGGVHGNNEDCRWALACSSGHPTVTWSSFDSEHPRHFHAAGCEHSASSKH